MIQNLSNRSLFKTLAKDMANKWLSNNINKFKSNSNDVKFILYTILAKYRNMVGNDIQNYEEI